MSLWSPWTVNKAGSNFSTCAAGTPCASPAQRGRAGAPAGLYLVCYDEGAGTCLICMGGEVIAEIAGERAQDILEHVRTLNKSDRAVFIDGVLFALRAMDAGGSA